MSLPVSTDLYMREGLKGQPTNGFYAPVINSVAWGGDPISADKLFGTAVRYAPAPSGGPIRTDVVDLVTLLAISTSLAGIVVRTRAADNAIGGDSAIINTGDSLSVMVSGAIYIAADGLFISDPQQDNYIETTVGDFTGFFSQTDNPNNYKVSEYMIIHSNTGTGGVGTEGPTVRASFNFQYLPTRGS